MAVPFSSLPVTSSVADDDYIALLDTSESLLKRVSVGTLNPDFTGATASSNGVSGQVPAPQAGDENKALKGDGTWGEAGEISWTGTTAQWDQLSSSAKAEYDGKKVYITDDYMQNIPVMTGASVNDDGYKGVVPTPYAGDQDKFLQGNGIWTADTANLTTTFTSSDDATETGLIVASGDTAMTAVTSGDTHGGLFGLISKSVLNTRKLINTVKRVWNSVGATWVSGHAYAVNDMVVYENGHVYKCKAAHTSSASILPTNTTYWMDTTLANEIASLNNSYANLKWKLAGTKTGTTAVSLPSSFRELFIQIKLPNSEDLSYSLFVVKDILSSTRTRFFQGWYQYNNASNIYYGNCKIAVSTTSAYIDDVRAMNSSIASTSTIIVYYR